VVKAKKLNESGNEEFDMDNNEIPSQPTKRSSRKKGPSSTSNNKSNKTTKVTT
jgi:hypothetical protein